VDRHGRTGLTVLPDRVALWAEYVRRPGTVPPGGDADSGGERDKQLRGTVGFVVLITWFAAVLMGLFMLAVWLIENDVTDRGVAPSRLPVVVVFTHMGLAAAGLGLWVAFLVLERTMFAWVAIGILGGIAVLGATMFLRWIPVYRHTAPLTGTRQPPAGMTAAPAEGNFPVAIVALHGLLAVCTLVLALLTVLGVAAPE